MQLSLLAIISKVHARSLLALAILQIKNLPKGATVIDYAYQIHTDLGNNMVAAKVHSVNKFSELLLSTWNAPHQCTRCSGLDFDAGEW